MRPELSALNASLAYQRRERQKAEEESRKECEKAYGRGLRSAESRYSCKTYKSRVEMRCCDMVLPFEERMKIAKENLARELAKQIINDIYIDHDKLPYDGEVWTAMIPVGKTERLIIDNGWAIWR
ncbi:MAG: hypothetical protein IKG37_04385 [Solobacterium sp.]|nr:hypothetical protein [Solobacterium sp.]